MVQSFYKIHNNEFLPLNRWGVLANLFPERMSGLYEAKKIVY